MQFMQLEKQWKQLKCQVKDRITRSLPIVTFWNRPIYEDSKRIKGKKVVVSSFCKLFKSIIMLNLLKVISKFQ